MQRCVIAAALLWSAGCSGTPDGPLAVVTPARGGSPVTIAVEVADDPAERQQGLMWRKELADDHGMIFIFDEDEDHAFWMKNTLIPLDMIFIAREGPGAGRIVGIRANTKPLSLASVGVGKPSRWVLEVPAGYAARRGLETGDRVELTQVPAAR